jgi:hypothetical protein
MFEDKNDQSTLGRIISRRLHSIDDQAIKELWSNIGRQEGEVVMVGNDADNRPKFVGLQALIEANIAAAKAQNKITAVVGVIHTKFPATPLRSDGTIAENLVAPEIMQDPQRLATVLKRPDIIRNFLAVGGRLIAAYPRSSLQEPIPGFETFQSLLRRHRNLIDFPLNEFSDEYTGATYLIEENSGEITCFLIKATQANSPSNSEMGIWFGPYKAKVRDRVDKINNFLIRQGLDLFSELDKSKQPNNPEKPTAFQVVPNELGK